MKRKLLDRLPGNDPLHHYLQHDIFPLLGNAPRHPSFRVYRLNGSNDVYLYEDRNSGTAVVGKFFLTRLKPDPRRAAKRMVREFRNLERIRDLGLTRMPHYVSRPLGHNQWLNCLLVVEYCPGEPLDAIITAAISQGAGERLFRKLTALAYFLATLHNRSASEVRVNVGEDCVYLNSLLARLVTMEALDRSEAAEFASMRDRWRGLEYMWSDCKVLIHGDATPDNFLFGSGLEVIAIDLERSKYADRVFDVGRICGELKHFFYRATGNRHAAEPFIGHFLWEYCCHFPDRDKAFRAITARIPFHIGMTLLRIARNDWIDPIYRRSLVEEAKRNFRRFA